MLQLWRLSMSLRGVKRTVFASSVSVAPIDTATGPRWLRPLLLILTGILLLSLFTGEIRDTDVWLHMKTGQHSFETRALTVPDPFSYTSGMGAKYSGEEITRYFNLTSEWLAQVVMYLIYRAAGFAGLVLVRAALLIVFCGLAGWIAFRRTEDFYIGLASALVAAGMAFHFQQSRPFLITFVGLAVTMAILESRRWMWVLPVVFLIWANCHAGFFMGWLVLGAYCGEAVIERLRRRPVADERRLWLVAAACFLVSGVNPNGFRVVQILFLYRTSVIQSNNLEWQRPIFWESGIYSLLLFGSLLAMLAGSAPHAACGLVALSGLRCDFSFGDSEHDLPGADWSGVDGGLPSQVAGFCRLSRCCWRRRLCLFSMSRRLAKRGNVFALRAAEWQLPSGAADFIQARGIAGRMFNNYETGGYLVWRLWPLQRDFIDPRGLSEEAFADYRRILTNADSWRARLLQKYGIQMVVTEGFDYLSGQVYPLVMGLAECAARSGNWSTRIRRAWFLCAILRLAYRR